jgi:F-type H+-transporting ATPase subunit b
MNDLLQALGINGTDLLISIVGFLLLWYLLAITLFRPIQRIQQERAQEITTNLQRAEDDRNAMAHERDELDSRLSQVEVEAREQIRQATVEARAARDKILAEARDQAHGLLERGREEIGREREKAIAEIQQHAADLGAAMAATALRQKLDEEMHRALVADFLSDLERLQS